MKFEKAVLNIVNIKVSDIITTSDGEIASCKEPGAFVEVEDPF